MFFSADFNGNEFPGDALLLGAQPTRTGKLRCPHCKAVGLKRNSVSICDTHRVIHYACSNIACGHTWRASETYEYGLSPSAIPDPRVSLPLRQLSRQEVLEAMAPRDPSQPGLFDPPPLQPPEPPG
ncbi:ogr/Delta-like zinc finger family protein [Novosphingobium sp.]|uniref:ogr/Delta-like zinc finger family protein n=1 Tax=Novosphingobium sp. TaxID=1874826 RepID=UPI0038BA52CD